MKNICICDATIKENSKQGSTVSFKEKLEIAKRLNDVHVDVIELGSIIDKNTDSILFRTVSAFVDYSTVSCSAGLSLEEIELAYEAVSVAKKKRLSIAVPVSNVQMEYAYHIKSAKLAELATKAVEKAKSLCADVEVCFEDATRAEPAFLYSLINSVIESGATVITLCDLSGNMLPESFVKFIDDAVSSTPALKNVALYVQCANTLNMAAACSFAAAVSGVNGIKACVTNTVMPSLENVANIFGAIGAQNDLTCNLKAMEISRAVKQILQMLSARKTTSAFNSVIREEGANLDGKTTVEQLSKVIKKRGYDLSDEDVSKVYESFSRVAAKKSVNLKELDAIIASAALQVSATYKLISYVINSGNIISSTANITVERSGETYNGLSNGDGPIDAAFLAIEKITGHHFELDDLQIQAVTEGREAMGEAIVKLRASGKLYSGRGISTDIIGASIRAYMNALNKIVYEENNA